MAMLDTLTFSERLIDSGFTEDQARGRVHALSDSLDESLVTRRDLAEALTAQEERIMSRVEALLDQRLTLMANALREEMRAGDAALQAEFRTELGHLREEMRAEMLQALKDLELRLTLRLGAMMALGIVAVGALAALL